MKFKGRVIFIFFCRDESLVAKYKSRVTALQEKVRALEEGAQLDNAERSKSLKELATERGWCLCVGTK